ncbi:MAG: hypothetical protein ACI37V_08075 [Methanobrevibacter sp.]
MKRRITTIFCVLILILGICSISAVNVTVSDINETDNIDTQVAHVGENGYLPAYTSDNYTAYCINPSKNNPYDGINYTEHNTSKVKVVNTITNQSVDDYIKTLLVNKFRKENLSDGDIQGIITGFLRYNYLNFSDGSNLLEPNYSFFDYVLSNGKTRGDYVLEILDMVKTYPDTGIIRSVNGSDEHYQLKFFNPVRDNFQELIGIRLWWETPKTNNTTSNNSTINNNTTTNNSTIHNNTTTNNSTVHNNTALNNYSNTNNTTNNLKDPINKGTSYALYNTGNPLYILLFALAAIGLVLKRR